MSRKLNMSIKITHTSSTKTSKTQVQAISGTFRYYARAVDTILPALNDVSKLQSKSTKKTAKA